MEKDETIILRNLQIGYPLKHGSKVVASGINATLQSGQLTCLLGSNGVGKSTLLRTLSAFQPALSGEVLLLGKSINDYSPRQLSQLIGVVLTEKPDARHMTVRELVSLGRSPYTGFWGTLNADDHSIVEESIHLVGIEALSSRTISTLSDGERQKAMIAKALAQQTDIIFLDEPTAFLDFPSKVEVMQLLRRLAATLGKTIFMSTHDLELALQMADTLWLMQTTDNSTSSMTEDCSLKVGSPRELANEGILSSFINRQGISFSPSDFRIKVER